MVYTEGMEQTPLQTQVAVVVVLVAKGLFLGREATAAPAS
jgi:hypothetical protein